MHRSTRQTGTFTLAVAVLSAAGWCKLAHVWEPVPISRLLANVGKHVAQQPNDATAWYTLGRIHSLAYIRGEGNAEVILKNWRTNKPLPLPAFPAFESVLVQKRAADADWYETIPEKPGPHAPARTAPGATLSHLRESVRCYGRAVELMPKDIYRLGLAWMLERGAPRAASVGPPPGEPAAHNTPDAWRARSLREYRRLFELTREQDAAKQYRDGNSPDYSLSVEAGEGILRLLKSMKAPGDRDEVARIEAHIRTINAKPMVISPIILPFGGSRDLAGMLAGEARFDLAATGRTELWPWVAVDTGILVWDPERKGRIRSGAQLFGNRTWNMFWRDGYEPLAALDDDGNGWLEGKELEGLAIWRDRNGNGRSDRGEVTPVAQLGIRRIAVHAAGTSEGTLFNPRGVETTAGWLPTYDWTPQSIPDEPRCSVDVPSLWE